jgi:hypothetical protein
MPAVRSIDHTIRSPAATWSLVVNCQEALERMADLVDGDLSRWDRFRLRLHLGLCRLCRRYLASYRATIRAAKTLSADNSGSAGERIPDDLISTILTASGHPPRRPDAQTDSQTDC